MYLKSIEVHGFKSFANKIDFQFHNGITGIVGPNGSGKSNVADAVRWVLGEQSARQLRGSSMQDVIFSGTQNRKAMGYASVAITLDNADHQLPSDFEEVTVTRKVYRSGESEYLINGTACRLKDINELFYDTGIGKEGYSIIGQGQIERILSGKPEDRRELFDEAAGIVKFKRRKAVTIKKLSEEENNFTRVSDIISELERQVGPLENQAEKAKVFLKKREELKRLDANVFLLEEEKISTALTEMEKRAKIVSEELKETEEKLDTIKEDYSRTEEQLSRYEALLDDKTKLMSESQVARQKDEGEIAVLMEQINSASATKEHFEKRNEQLSQQISEKDKELSLLIKKKKEIDENVERAIEDRDNAKESAKALSDSIAHISQSLDKLNGSLIDGVNSRNEISSRLSKYDASIEQINIRKAQLNSRIIQAKSEEEEAQGRLLEVEKDFKRVCGELADMDRELADNERKIGQITTDIHGKEDEKADAQKRYHEINSRLEAARNMAERYEGYGAAIKRVMERKDKRVRGVVADILKVDKKYETAIETALGGNIQNIVTDDEETAKDMIRFLRENRLGRATFLPLTSVTERDFNAPDALKEKGAIGLADTLVQIDKKYKNIASHLLHNYIVVDNIDNAMAMARKFKFTLRCVTLTGEAVNPGGSMSGGSFKNNSNLLGRNREMEELSGELEKVSKNMEELTGEIEKLRDKRTGLRALSSEIREKQQDKFIEQNTAKLKLDQIKARQDEMKERYGSLHNEEAEIALTLAQIESEKKNTSKELETSMRSESDTHKKIEEQTGILNKRQEDLARLTENISKYEVEAAQMLSGQEYEQSNIDRVQEEKQRLTDEFKFNEMSLKQGGNETAEKQKQIVDIKNRIEILREREKRDAVLIEETRRKKDELSVSMKGHMDLREQLSDRKSNLDNEVYRINSQIEKLNDQKESRFTYMWNEYELTPATAKELRDESLTDLGAMKKETVSIRGFLRELGSVNVNAINEYTQLMERYEFMRSQRDDIVAAKESLEKIIAELDEGMRTQFTEKFEQIAKQFDKVFKQMFGGGTGTLELLEDEDILEAGIKIVAQPPGKKLQNMMQLSGGEKALTAIALLFAIQNLKPSPFCLLDEIEAALDESNVSRFAGYLQKLTKSTQFIVITHRRGTMEKADRLYGITMQEKGVSALVSVDMIDDKDLK